MRPSRGMGAIKESKMPKGVTKKRRDDTDFTQYKKGGSIKSIDKLSKQKLDTTRIGKKEGGPVGLYANMNARKKKGISRDKSESTIDPKAYANMKAGFPKGRK
jgi:hypothetical protein